MTTLPESDPSPASAPTRFGRYVMERPVASGGMGEIWVATDEQLQRRVAVKLMHPSDGPDPHRFERFEREAKLVAQLQHPHVVRVYDYGIGANDTPFIVMELLEGEDLQRRLTRTGPMSLGVLVPIVMQAAKGMHAAHRAGIIHHDLKPANLFLARQGSEHTVKVLDFGIATIRPVERVAKEGRRVALVGTPQYMSPEQMRGGVVDHRTDLWSLAVVAYEVLTGHAPFGGSSIGAVVNRVIGEQPDPPSKHVPALGPEVDAFFERALAKDPADRFASALELAAAFSELDDRGASRTSTILVVDDEPDLEVLVRQRFRRQIRKGRYDLLFAHDGQEALEVLAQRPDIDVVLTDINMPRMDGLTLLGRLGRAGPAQRAVVLTAYGDMRNIRAAMNAGAYDFLTKPIDFTDLEATLEKALRDVRELRRALRSIEENDALRLFVDDSLLERLLPLLRVSSELSSDTIDATIVSLGVWGIDERAETEPAATVFDLLNRSFDVIVPVVNTWKGVLVRIHGASAIAIFQGEDHLWQACSACCAIRAALSEVALGVCVGLDSGPVLSGSVGSKTIQRLDYTVLGRTVSQALALRQIAERGQVLLPDHIAKRLSSSFAVEPIEGAPADLGVVYNLERPIAEGLPAVTGMTETLAVDG